MQMPLKSALPDAFTERYWLVSGLLCAFPKVRIGATQGLDLQMAKGQRMAPRALRPTSMTYA